MKVNRVSLVDNYSRVEVSELDLDEKDFSEGELTFTGFYSGEVVPIIEYEDKMMEATYADKLINWVQKELINGLKVGLDKVQACSSRINNIEKARLDYVEARFQKLIGGSIDV